MINIDHSPQLLLEYFLHRNSTQSQAIYITVLAAILSIFALLPIIHVNVSVQGNGIVRPISEKTEVKAIASEMIEQVFVKENQFVTRGAPILQLRTDNIISKIKFLQYQKNETSNSIADLTMLVAQKSVKGFRTPLYQQEYFFSQKQTEELRNKRDKALKEYSRNKTLYDNGVIAEKDYDDLRFQYETTNNEYKISTGNQVNKWQADLTRYKTSLGEIESNIAQLLKEKEFYTIKAPVSGTVEQFSGIYPGSSLRSGETVAVISPDSTLVSEIYISPKDIGYINKDYPVKIQVGAFNYNEWGTLKGSVKEISSDFVLINNSPMFRVRCTMDKNWLSLKNGIRGNLKKGMNIRASFLVTKRSLFQLLYQGIDDWINPTQYAGINFSQ
jgi:multidrug resistance efflux pump